MRTLAHLRWHLALALAGALLVERLHWQLATIVIAMIAVDRVVTTVGRLLGRKPVRAGADRRAASGDDPAPLGRATPRMPVALKQALGAACPSCRGFGCRTCAYTGLS